MIPWPGSEDAALIRTPDYDAIAQQLPEVLEVNGILLVSGESGLGKTGAVEDALARSGRPHRRFVMPSKMTRKQVAWEIASGLGVTPKRGDTEWQVLLDVREALSDDEALREEHGVFLADEGKGLGADGLAAFHWAREILRPPTWSLILVGTDLDTEILKVPALDNRIERRWHFNPWTVEQALEYLPRYHRLFAKTDPGTLTELYRDYLGGVFRSWAKFLGAAKKRLPTDHRGGIPRQVALASAIALVGNGRRAA